MMMNSKAPFHWNEDPLDKTPGALPAGLRLYVFGDIHGRLDLLQDLHDRLNTDIKTTRSDCHEIVEIYLGDYIDRGLRSKQVIDLLAGLERHDSRRKRIFLKGNHEDALLRFLDDAQVLARWQLYGGKETLGSYGVACPAPLWPPEQFEAVRRQLAQALPTAHKRFFANLQMSATYGSYFFAHAGARPGVPLHKQSDTDLMTIRDDFLDSEADHGKIIVHGHTPVVAPEIWKNRINIDTRAFATGNLTCLVLEGHLHRYL